MANKGRIFDELLSFLGDPIFQIPVRTFMDENSLIFDPSIEAGEDHKEIHAKYKRLVDTLLETFCQDAHISQDEATRSILKMNEIPDIRGVFEVLFEQVLAANDFQIFYQVMVKRNMIIQEQVLLMIIAATGSIPDSMTPYKQDKKRSSRSPRSPDMPAGGDTGGKAKIAPDQDEEELLQKVMQASKEDFERSKQADKKSSRDYEQVLELSKQEVTVIQENRSKLEEQSDLKKMHLEPVAVTAVKKSNDKPVAAAPKGAVPVVTASKAISNEDAASLWLKSAQAEAQTSTHRAMAESLSKLSQDELKSRADFLKTQRDKLLAMKKDAREKQLGEATKSTKGRPQSARAARSAMGGKDTMSEEDRKKIEMRKAIAEKLRAEVIGKQ